MMVFRERRILWGIFLSAIFFSAEAALAAEEHTIDAIAPWEGRGQIYPVGTDIAQFVGAFSGSLFVADKASLRPGGSFVCPATMEFNLATNALSGSGRCVISNQPDERIFATWSCSGEFGKGCNGTFTLVDGTGPWQGVTGSGPFSAQTDLHVFALNPGNVVSQSSKGLMLWRGFTYRLP